MKCFSLTTKEVGLTAKGPLNAAFELWHVKRRYFTQPDYKPDDIQKVDIEAALETAKAPRPTEREKETSSS